MKIVTINKRRYNFPEGWDELSEGQLLQVMEILFLKQHAAEAVLLQLVKVLAGMSRYRFLRCKAEELEEFFYLLQFVLQPDFSFTKNLLPRLGKFYGPADGMQNLRMKEFTFTEAFFIQWCESEKKDIAALNNLVAILYRPAPAGYDTKRNPEGDCRAAYSQGATEWAAKHTISKWPMAAKLAIAHWYDGCRRAIAENNSDVFGGSGEPARYGLVSVMLNVAESHVFGDFEKVENQYVNLVMMQLNELVDKARKIEAQSKL